MGLGFGVARLAARLRLGVLLLLLCFCVCFCVCFSWHSVVFFVGHKLQRWSLGQWIQILLFIVISIFDG